MINADSLRHFRGARAFKVLVVILLCCHQAQGFAAPNHERFAQSLAVTNDTVEVKQKVEQGLRRIKSTKGTVPESDSKPNENGNPSTGMPTTSPQTLTVPGLEMTLSGVAPLDSQSRITWQDITRGFVEADILNTIQGIVSLKVDVYFDHQDPPFQSRRQLSNTGDQQPLSRLLVGQELAIMFDVNMLIESKDGGNHDVLNYVTSSFNDAQKRAAYIQELKATGDPAFTSASMSANLVPNSTTSPSNGKKIGIIVGITIVVLIIFGCVAFVLHGNKTNAMATQVVPEVEDDKDDESLPEAPMASAQTDESSDTASNGIPMTIMVDDNESQYFGGNVSVAWSLDTERQATLAWSLDAEASQPTINSKMC